MAKSSKRKMQAKDLFRLVLPNAPSLSPDGKDIVYALKKTDAKENKYVSNIYRVSVRGGAPRQLTTGKHMDSSPVYSPNGRWIAFVSKRDDKTSQIWILPTDGGEARQLTKLEYGPIRQLAWSPDSKQILFGHRKEEHKDPKEKKKEATFKHITRLRHKLDGDGYWPKERWHLWTVSVPGGTAKQITFGEDDDWGGSWSPDGKRIAFVSNRMKDADYHPDNSDIYVVSAKGGKPKQITRRFGMVDAPTWSANGRWIYYMGNFGKDGEWNKLPIHIYRIPSNGGDVLDLTPDLEYWPINGTVTDTAMSDFDGILMPYFEDGEERLAIHLTERGGVRLYSLSTKGGELRPEFTEDVNIVGVSIHRQRPEAGVVAARMMDSGDVYHVPLNGSGKVTRLTNANKSFFNSLDLTEPEEVVFQNGRVKIQGWILKPPGFRSGRKHPTLLEVHGGPMCQYGYTFFHEMHLLAAQGYVVVFSNPRGSDGFGTHFRCCIDGKWGTIDYEDCMAVVDDMVKRPYVDGKRLGILGGSYGGFMTTWTVGHTDRFKAAVTQRQAGNEYSFFGSSDFGFYQYYEYKAFPWEDPMKYLERSPNFYVGNINTPLLVVHSENDYRCPLSQAEELFVALKMQKKTVELVQFEGEPHGLSRGGKPQNRLERLNRIVGWFKKYL
jgi:dipeptidyl aminopeptidase/acylaminoacyl peptidase